MDDGTLTVLNPIGEAQPVPLAAGAGVRRPGTLRGKRIAIVDNSFPGMRETADALEPILKGEFGAAEVHRWRLEVRQPWGDLTGAAS